MDMRNHEHAIINQAAKLASRLNAGAPDSMQAAVDLIYEQTEMIKTLTSQLVRATAKTKEAVEIIMQLTSEGDSPNQDPRAVASLAERLIKAGITHTIDGGKN